MTESLSHKLAVILHADVADSTKLVRLNEKLAHQRIQDAFQRLSDSITEHGGTAHELRGDALVAEFAKASDAVTASLSYQNSNADHNEGLSDEIRPVVRVGIAMGEVVIGDDTVTGLGVVLAQRIEQLADPGGVCIQGAVYETVPRRLSFDYVNLGERELKGFDEPTRVYSVKQHEDGQQSHVGTSVTKNAKDKPSIVVLPFTNRSSDPEQEYFSDGLTEDVITALSRYRELVVTASSSSWEFKDKSEHTTEIAKRLGVQYVLQGSSRKSGDKLRVTVQLIDGPNGARLWAETYDRALTDVFEVQDDITRSIVSMLAGQIEEASRKASLRKSNSDLSAYDLVLRAKNCFRDWTGGEQDILQARALYEEALKQDAECARAYTGLAETYLAESMSSWTTQGELAVERAMEFAQKALAIDALDSSGHSTLANVYKRLDSNFERAIPEMAKAISLNPNDYWNHCAMSGMCVMAGELDEAIASAGEGMRRNPMHPDNCFMVMGLADYLAGRYESAIDRFRSLLGPRSEAEAYVAACCAKLERFAEAEAAATNFRKLNSVECSFEAETQAECWRNHWSTAWAARDLTILDSLLDGLCQAKIVTDAKFVTSAARR